MSILIMLISVVIFILICLFSTSIISKNFDIGSESGKIALYMGHFSGALFVTLIFDIARLIIEALK